MAHGPSTNIEIRLITMVAGAAVEKVVARDKVSEQTNIKNFLTWYAARLFNNTFKLRRDEGNVFGWIAVDANRNRLAIRYSQQLMV